MQRQTSILSFLKKPDASAGVKPAALDVTDGDIKGTDTPPEKVPRRIFADSRPSLFSTIKHKFAKADNPTNSSSNSRYYLEASHQMRSHICADSLFLLYVRGATAVIIVLFSFLPALFLTRFAVIQWFYCFFYWCIQIVELELR